jgi:hypothetical protein
MLSFSLIVRYLLSACSSSPFTLLVSALPASKLAISQYDLEAPHFHSGVFETHPNHRLLVSWLKCSLPEQQPKP